MIIKLGLIFFGYNDLKLYDSAFPGFGSLHMYDNEFFVKTPSNEILLAVGYNYLEVFDYDGNKSFSFAQAGTDITTDVQLFITPKKRKITCNKYKTTSFINSFRKIW